MKNKLSVLIIGVAIWLGVSDIMKNVEMLKSETTQLIVKSSAYILSMGNDESEDSSRENTFAKQEALIARAIKDLSATAECESAIEKGVNTNQQTSARTNRTQIILDLNVEQYAQSQTGPMQRDHNEEIARIVASDVERISEDAVRVANKARMIEQITFRTRYRVSLPKVVLPLLKKETDHEFSTEFQDYDTDSGNESGVVPTMSCPTKVSNEKRLKRLVVLLPEILQKVGE